MLVVLAVANVWFSFIFFSEEEEDELMPFFNIYMQILISQALEPGFLAAINEEKGE